MPPWREAEALGIMLRPMRDEDLPFTALLYASTREEELAVVSWPEEAKRMFLAQQHAAQHAHYRLHYPDMEAMIVEHDGAAVGRLYLLEMAEEVRVVDIALLPAARGRGLGGALLRDVLADAGARGKAVTIHVEKNNPARTLYARLGFTVRDADRGPYDLMAWQAAA